jgi:hypothetical protein
MAFPADKGKATKTVSLVSVLSSVAHPGLGCSPLASHGWWREHCWLVGAFSTFLRLHRVGGNLGNGLMPSQEVLTAIQGQQEREEAWNWQELLPGSQLRQLLAVTDTLPGPVGSTGGWEAGRKGLSLTRCSESS